MSTADKSGVSPPTKKPKLLSGAGGAPVSATNISLGSSNTQEPMDIEVNGSGGGGNGVHHNEQHKNGAGNIDEGLYSRQLYVLGTDAMKKMAKSNVLISGLGGLGVEIAKNVCLGGVRSVTLHDTTNTSWNDLSSQFYLRKSDIGKNRASASLEQVAQLNPYVPVNVRTEQLTVDILKDFHVVVIADRIGTEEDLIKLSKYCHDNKIGFIMAETRGLFSRLFCDFGEGFEIYDVNGETVGSAMISSVSQEENGIVTCLEDSRHGFEDGDFVTFTEVVGMEELNGCEPIKIQVKGPYQFTIGDTSGFTSHERGGIAVQVKKSKTVDFKSLEESITDPETVITDYAKMDHSEQLHLGFRALDRFVEKNGRLPRPWNGEDAGSLVEFAKDINETNSEKSRVEKLNERLLHLFSFVSSGNLCPMNAFLGGVAAQEVMKACSGKFSPIKQWLYYDAVECLPQFNSDEPLTNIHEANFAPVNHRSDGNVAVFGKEFQNRLGDLKYFVVGAGAIGCELLKNFAMMGVAAGEKGQIIITDMDLIERSNLNRQFLFRPKDVGQPKSTCAALAAKAMNQEVNIVAHENFVGLKTEHIYTDEFFEQLDGVANALDNVEARNYMDRRCVYYRKPLLESGTLGTKGNTQVILPYMTESYSSSQDPPEREIPICTLKNFPNAIEHTLQWARDLFQGVFRDAAKCASDYLNDPKFIASTLKKPGAQPLQDLEAVKKCLVDERPQNMQDCVNWARNFWEDNFNNQIQQLLFNFPPNQETTSGQLFWSGPKRCPQPLTFNTSEYAQDFIFAAANLRAEMYGISQLRDPVAIRQMAELVEVPVFVPRQGVRIAVTDAEAQSMEGATDDERIHELIRGIPSAEALRQTGVRITPLEFEKDDDNNLHIDFIVATSNSRAVNYKITPANRLQSKLIAGKIIPAIATTTSVVGGLISLELYKVAFGYKDLERYKNGFVNLALPFFGFSEPIKPATKKYYDKEWTLWDRFDIGGEMSLQQFLDYFQNEHRLEITMLSQGVCMLYSFFMAADKRVERLPLPICQVVRLVSKARLPAHVRALVFELCCNDEEGEDVEVPYVRYVIPQSQLVNATLAGLLN